MKYILAIVLFLLAVTVYFVSQPEPEFEVGKKTATEPAQGETAPVESAPEAPADPAAEQSAEDKRVADMKAEFEKLEKARRNLERRLSRLKAVFYGVELPPDERNAITDKMKTGYGLLKNRKLLASYDGPQSISDELAKVEYISNYLQEVEETYRAQRMQKQSN